MGCENIINLQQEGGENILNLEREMNVGGAVDSVNGMTGDVVLTTSDLENTSDYQTGSEVESAISSAVGAEATLRANADTALGGRIDNLVTGLGNETLARQNADNGLQGQIDALAASSDVTDIVGTKAQLDNYDTSKLNDNDIIKVLQDESQNDETTYYRWSTTNQSFTLIGEEGPYYTKAESNVLLQAKQDVLTAGANINITNNVISSTDTTYSAGNAITIDANNEISADIYPADYFTAEASMTETGSEVSFDGTIPASMSFDNLYGDSEQQTYTGKNILYIPSGTSTSNGITWTKNGNTVSGTTTGTTGSYSATSAWLSYTLPAGTYTFSIGEAVTKRVQFARRVDSSSPAQTVNLPAGDTSITFTNNEPTSEYHVVLLDTSGASLTDYTIKDIQLEAGSEATSFEPYVGGVPAPNPQYPQDVHTVTGVQTFTISDGDSNSQTYTVDLSAIELVKIGDYQDYIYKTGGNWYLHKETATIASYAGESISTEYLSTTGQLTTGATVYYVLNTPTDTQITDSSLISQLDTLNTAYSYNGETNIVISATGTNLPAIAKVTATKNSASGIVKELENVVTSAELDSRLGGLTLLPISQTDYDALSTKDPNTLYVITGA